MMSFVINSVKNNVKNNEYQKINLCIQTYYNLYGVMPDTKELTEMLGEEYASTVSQPAQAS